MTNCIHFHAYHAISASPPKKKPAKKKTRKKKLQQKETNNWLHELDSNARSSLFLMGANPSFPLLSLRRAVSVHDDRVLGSRSLEEECECVCAPAVRRSLFACMSVSIDVCISITCVCILLGAIIGRGLGQTDFIV
jgi:uncharacterized membrane-anchored protein